MNPSRTATVNIVVLIAGTALLFAGGVLYVLFRPTTLLLFHAAEGMGIMDDITRWRLSASAWQPAEFVVFSLPAGLWSLSYVLIMGALTAGLPFRERLTATAFVPLLGVVSELMQAAGILPGTFDWADLALYVTPVALHFIYLLKE